MRNYMARAGQGRYEIEVQATPTGDGIIVQVLGGEKPHVGAVVLSLPRPSVSEPGKIRANSTVVPLYGHRDDEVARPVAEQLAAVFNQPVVVVAGVHIDAARPEEIELLVKNVGHAVAELITLIKVEMTGV
ncbi:MAG: hypothetical protein AB1510_11145 [Bacillota bacterium]